MLLPLALICLDAIGLRPTPSKVYVVLWFDTEDYILPESDDAAKRLAAFLTEQGIQATFKVVGEKARTLERRQRTDVRSEEHTSELQSQSNLVCRLLLEKKKYKYT